MTVHLIPIAIHRLRLWPALARRDPAAKHGLDIFEECRAAERPADGFRPAQAVVEQAVTLTRVEHTLGNRAFRGPRVVTPS